MTAEFDLGYKQGLKPIIDDVSYGILSLQRGQITGFEQPSLTDPTFVYLQTTVRALSNTCQRLEKELHEIRKSSSAFIKISLILGKRLKTPLDAIVEPDDGGFIARTLDIPLYGYGDSSFEAVEALKAELDSLYTDLTGDDKFSDEWLEIKRFLQENLTGSEK